MAILSNTVKSESGDSKDKTHDVSTDIAHEFKTFVNDIENLVKGATSLTGDELAQVKLKIHQRINAAKQCIGNASDAMIDQARKTATRTNEYVHEKPWTIICAGAVVSFVLGVLIGNRDDKSAK